MGPERYRHATIRLHKDREPERLARQIADTVHDYGGIATFRLYGRSGRQLADTLKRILDPDFNVLVVVPDREGVSPRNRDWYRRHITELLVRIPSK